MAICNNGDEVTNATELDPRVHYWIEVVSSKEGPSKHLCSW